MMSAAFKGFRKNYTQIIYNIYTDIYIYFQMYELIETNRNKIINF